MSKIVGYIYEADENERNSFSFIEGNRDVSEKRKDAIRDSYYKVGVRPSIPIVVNGNREIIDGQGRYCVCIEDDLPIYYTVDEDAGEDVCIAVNTGTKNWTIHDFVNFYVHQGRPDYVVLNEMVEKHGLTPTIVAHIANGDIVTSGGRSSATWKIKHGEFKLWVSREPLDDALAYVKKCSPLYKKIGGRVDTAALTIAWIVLNVEIDRERLFSSLIKIANDAEEKYYAVSSAAQFAMLIEQEYNKGLKIESRRKKLSRMIEDYADERRHGRVGGMKE